MKVSVVIPTYNEESTISACLESLSKQTYKDMEIIVIDDGSTDKTIEKCQMSNVKCQILKQNHKGPGEARNLSAQKAKGEILVFVDADMTFERDFIKKLVAPIVAGKTKGTFSKDEYVSNWENVWAQCWNINEGWEEKKRHPKDYPDHQKVFRAILKSEFDRVGGFEKGGHYTDDWSLSEKLGYEAIVVPKAVFYHKNPGDLVEVFKQSKWAAKRQYKLGILGLLVGLLRVSLPISLVVGIAKSIVYREPGFFIFKIVYDFGAFVGIIEYLITNKGFK